MRLTQLEYFKDVAQTLNISQTAAELHVSQPAISRSIHELESELNLTLFIRKGKKLSLSQEGLVFKQTVDNIFNQLTTGLQQLEQLKQHAQSRIIFTIANSTPLMVEIIEQLHHSLPETTILVRVNSHSLPASNPGFIDYYYQLTDHPLAGYQSVPLLTERIGILVSNNSSLAKLSALSLADLDTGLIKLSASPFQALVDRYLTNHQVALPTVITTGDRKIICDMVSHNLGIAFIPEFSWHAYLNSQQVCFVPLKDEQLQRTIYLNYIQPKESEFHHKVVTSIQKYFTKYQTRKGHFQ